MKKVILYAAVAFAAVAGTVCYNSESGNENEMLSDLAKANVKALAGTNAVELPCVDSGIACIFIAKDADGHYRVVTIDDTRRK